MLCEICRRGEATKKLNRIINGSVKTYNVCLKCFNYGSRAFLKEEKKCRFCGRALSEINATLLVGCPHCYDEFKEELDPVIRQVQRL